MNKKILATACLTALMSVSVQASERSPTGNGSYFTAFKDNLFSFNSRSGERKLGKEGRYINDVFGKLNSSIEGTASSPLSEESKATWNELVLVLSDQNYADEKGYELAEIQKEIQLQIHENEGFITVANAAAYRVLEQSNPKTWDNQTTYKDNVVYLDDNLFDLDRIALHTGHTSDYRMGNGTQGISTEGTPVFVCKAFNHPNADYYEMKRTNVNDFWQTFQTSHTMESLCLTTKEVAEYAEARKQDFIGPLGHRVTPLPTLHTQEERPYKFENNDHSPNIIYNMDDYKI